MCGLKVSQGNRRDLHSRTGKEIPSILGDVDAAVGVQVYLRKKFDTKISQHCSLNRNVLCKIYHLGILRHAPIAKIRHSHYTRTCGMSTLHEDSFKGKMGSSSTTRSSKWSSS